MLSRSGRRTGDPDWQRPRCLSVACGLAAATGLAGLALFLPGATVGGCAFVECHDDTWVDHRRASNTTRTEGASLSEQVLKGVTQGPSALASGHLADSGNLHVYLPVLRANTALTDPSATHSPPWPHDRPDHARCIITRADYRDQDERPHSLVYTGLSVDNDRLWVDGDHDADGDVDNTLWYAYGRPHLPLMRVDDDGNDGLVDYVWIWRYDSSGRLVREERDDGGDGQANRIAIRGYDLEGRLAIESVDEDGNGTVDRWYERTYDAESRLVELRAFEFGTEHPYSLKTISYDGSMVSRIDYDHDADGLVDEWVVYFYVSTLLVKQEVWDTSGLESHTEYSYDPNDRLASATSYIDSVWRQTLEYSYDYEDRLIQRRLRTRYGHSAQSGYGYDGACTRGLNAPSSVAES